ncbi:MAG TPA: NAD(P)H-dependent oxidoreductase subunit E [Candidatus Binatia bacterium]|nr:NAD(P)H-dependent oxidoreductase subunit E [Candidatus Binatia bacterium]
MALEFSPEAYRQFQETVNRYPRKEAAILPVLYLAQQEFGYLGPEAIDYVARLMGQSPARVHGVVSFYTMLKTKPIGRHHIQVCRTLPCALRGAEQLTGFIKKTLGIEVGQTTPDGRFTLSEVECLASCGTAPMMQVNDDYYENLTDDKVTDILASLK